jgi:hypothetical protein
LKTKEVPTLGGARHMPAKQAKRRRLGVVSKEKEGWEEEEEKESWVRRSRRRKKKAFLYGLIKLAAKIWLLLILRWDQTIRRRLFLFLSSVIVDLYPVKFHLSPSRPSLYNCVR